MTTATRTPSDHDSVLARLRAARGLLAGIESDLVSVTNGDLAECAALAAAVVAQAQAVQAAVVLEASSRGVIAESDNPRPQRWVEQASREAGVPVARRIARDLHEVTVTCEGPDAEVIREAVVSGRLPVETAGLVAKTYRRLRRDIDHPHWDELAEIIIDWAASGATPAQLRAMEDQLLGQYGTVGALEDKHEHQYQLRGMSAFHPDRFGMLTATVRLDPASHAVVAAALDALSAPAPIRDERGEIIEADLRSPGQRRADALVVLAGHATSADPALPGTGVKARVTVTMSLADLTNRLGEIVRGGATGGANGVTATAAGGKTGIMVTASGNAIRTETANHADAPSGRAPFGYATTALDDTLSPSEARMLACDAQIIPAILGADSEILDLGRATRLVTPGQRAALHLRDKGCTYPGCGSPPGWCDGHHIQHWADDGPTDLTNLALLCRHHHTVVHRHSHTATVDEHGVRWTRTDGTPIGNTPRPHRT